MRRLHSALSSAYAAGSRAGIDAVAAATAAAVSVAVAAVAAASASAASARRSECSCKARCESATRARWKPQPPAAAKCAAMRSCGDSSPSCCSSRTTRWVLPAPSAAKSSSGTRRAPVKSGPLGRRVASSGTPGFSGAARPAMAETCRQTDRQWQVSELASSWGISGIMLITRALTHATPCDSLLRTCY